MHKAVIFDAFGTLLKVQNGQHPYRQLMRLGIAKGRRPRPDDAERIMSNSWGIKETACALGLGLPEDSLAELDKILKDEVESIEPYSDAIHAIELLQSKGVAVAVCTNLAMPYGAAVRRHFPHLEAYALSFEVGAIKPSLDMYEACCTQLSLEPSSIMMIGDSLQCDKEAPRSVGITGYFLDRHCGKGDYSDLLSFAVDVLKVADLCVN